MSKDDIEISRRKLLGGLGAVGLASAGAGMGTAALFSDEESFEGNTLTAGTLDLQVDWEEHYYNGNADPPNGETIGSLQLVDGPGGVGSGEVGLPDPADPIVAVASEDLDAFMDASRTDSVGGPESDPPAGVIDLSDVKPGDFGEVTYSYHLTGNPGYVQLEAEVTEDAENGVNEPEASASGEDGTQSSPGTDGELGEKIQAALWYDPDCDNVLDEGIETVIDRGSINSVLNGLPKLLDPTESGGRVADDYPDTNCHGTINTPDSPPFDCSEQLYLTNTVDDPNQDPGDDPYGSPSDDTTKLYRADINNGNAELTELIDLTGKADNNNDGAGDFNHVVSIAASPDGQTIYLIDKFSNRLGEYDVDANSNPFTDRGEITGGPTENSLQAAVSPAGELYFTVWGERTLYVIDDPSSSTSVDQTIQLTDQNGDPIEVGGSDIAFLSNGTLFLFDGNVNDGTPDLYRLPDPSTGNAELVSELSNATLPGLAVRAAGDGNLIGNDSTNNELYELDPSDGSKVATYDMVEVDDNGNVIDPDFTQQFGDMTVGSLCPEHCVALAWWVPRDVGNEIQSDTYEFDVTFRTEQCRNNDDPFCSCGSDEYVVEFPDGTTECVTPYRASDYGDKTVEAFYDYNSTEFYSENDAIQEKDVSNLLLYEGPNGDLSLVIINDDRDDMSTGGAASFTLDGLDSSSNDWLIQDDSPSGMDQYAPDPLDSTPATVDLTWAAGKTDGTVIGYLDSQFSIGVDAAFNDAAALDPHPNSPGPESDQTLTAWKVLSGDGSEVVLADGMSWDSDNEHSVTIRSGCD
jgi:predicted ribosomally synthesized peptide with SipW-like signal peptide